MNRAFQTGFLALCLLILGASVPAAPTAQSQSPVGKWKTISDETGEARSIVEIYEEDGKLYGKVVEILKASSKAKRNEAGEIICVACEGDKKNQPVEGMVIIEGLEKDGSEWEGGTILDPEKGKTYKAKIELKGADKLEVRGYVGISLFGRSQTWQRVEESASS